MDIIVVGAGPKAIATAAKAAALKSAGIVEIEVTVVEEAEVAANWIGSRGFTDGKQLLGTPPEKDLCFPYGSKFGGRVDVEMVQFSWQIFLIERGEYSDWIDRGRPQPPHEIWATYLKWAFERTKARLICGRVSEIIPGDNDFEVKVYSSQNEKSGLACDGIVLTGPGEPIKINNDDSFSEHVLDGVNYWQRLPLFADMKGGRIAIVGGGETAASILLSLLRLDTGSKIDLINRHGTVYTRGESFHENRLFSRTDEWQHLGELDREEFIKRTDRGVFSVNAKKDIDHAEDVRILSGQVVSINTIGGGVNLRVARKNGEHVLQYDKLILAMGFDSFSDLKLIRGFSVVDKVERDRIRKSVDYHLRPDINIPGRKPDAPRVNLHAPMLSGLAQGPGFPNLSCLGMLSDRILSTYTGY